MPVFGPQTLPDQGVWDVASYVQYLHHPDDRGGLSLGPPGSDSRRLRRLGRRPGHPARGRPADRHPGVTELPPAPPPPAGPHPPPPEAGTRFALQGREAADPGRRAPHRRRAGRSPRWRPSAWPASTSPAGSPRPRGPCCWWPSARSASASSSWPASFCPVRRSPRPRHDPASSVAEQDAVETSFARGGGAEMVRRSFLVRMLALAGGALGIAALFPINSLGPHPGDTLNHTSWSKGSRLVTEDGQPVRLGALAVDGVLTVFPEGHTDDAEAQTLLINIGDAPQVVPAGPPDLVGVGLRRLLEGVHPRRLPRRSVPLDEPPAALPLPPVDLRRARGVPPGLRAGGHARCPSCPLAVDDSGLSRGPERLHRARRPRLLGPVDEAPAPAVAGHRADGGPASPAAAAGRGGPVDRRPPRRVPLHPGASSTRSSPTTGRSCSARSPCTASSSWC